MMKALSILLCFQFAIVAFATDYCNPNLCRSGTHIGCNNNGQINGACAASARFSDLSSLKTIVVDLHNQYRQKIASGGVAGYKPAARMATAEWDDELAYLAGLNVKTCEFKHDQCHNTDKFKYSGQNLYWSFTSGEYTDEKVVKDAINSWFNEYQNADQSIIDKFRFDSTRKTYGHFTALVHQNNIRIGCALLQKKSSGGGNEYTVACNYAATNMIDYPIYVSGAPASKCMTGKNPTYPALCSVQEIIDANSY